MWVSQLNFSRLQNGTLTTIDCLGRHEAIETQQPGVYLRGNYQWTLKAGAYYYSSADKLFPANLSTAHPLPSESPQSDLLIAR